MRYENFLQIRISILSQKLCAGNSKPKQLQQQNYSIVKTNVTYLRVTDNSCLVVRKNDKCVPKYNEPTPPKKMTSEVPGDQLDQPDDNKIKSEVNCSNYCYALTTPARSKTSFS